MEMSKIIGLVGTCVCGLTVLFAILALALPSWRESKSEDLSEGLWKYCSPSYCINIKPEPSNEFGASLVAVRAMCFLGVFCIIGALVTGIIKVFVQTSNKMTGFTAGGLAIAAGFFLLIGFAVYVDKFGDDRPDIRYGAAFALDVVAWLMAWVTGGLFLAETIFTGRAT